jgi:hypothetical protein
VPHHARRQVAPLSLAHAAADDALAFRRSDVIRVGLPHTYAGPFLKYTQHKNRETKPITVDVPIPAALLAVIKATKATGLNT